MAITLGFFLFSIFVIAPLGARIIFGLNRRFSHLNTGVRYATVAAVMLVFSTILSIAVVAASHMFFGRPPLCGMGFPPSTDCP
jgi:hypothetical protein